MKTLLVFLLGCAWLSPPAGAQTAPLGRPMSQRMADAFLSWHPDSMLLAPGKSAGWGDEQGLMLKALERVWQRTGEARYFTYIEKDLARFVRDDGTIRTYRAADYDLANLATGRALLTMSQTTVPSQEKYSKAARLLRAQLAGQPRTREGGFWHQQTYPHQMWLDDLYTAAPFYAEYSQVFNQPAGFDEVAQQFALVEKHLVDPKTGLPGHGYDESRAQKWASPATGRSPGFWSRGLGWYAMALVDVLDYFPPNHPQRPQLLSALQRLAPVLARYQDAKTGTWALVVDQAARKGNYAEASGSSMVVYALAKGGRLGYLDKKYTAVARKGYEGLLKSFVANENGALAFNGTVGAGGLGGTPYRDGSYEYYLSEPLRQNDPKGVGPFILASLEMEIAATQVAGKGKTVGLDYYFNNEYRKSAITGEQERFHYTWEDRTNSGFWLWGNVFRELGARTVSVPAAPTAASLKGLDVYIIVDPDTRKETARPRFVQPADTKAVADWVQAGGTLVLMANDTANCEIRYFNKLASTFGIRFTNQSMNAVQGNQFEQGRLDIPPGNPIFKRTRAVFVKELSVLAVNAPASSVLSKGERHIIATARFGKGRVLAVGDPWLYNEYVDGRKIPAVYENFTAGKDLATWLLR